MKPKADALRKAKAKIDQLMNRSRSVFVTATKLIWDVGVVRGINAIQHGSRAQWIAFNKLYEILTSSAATSEHCRRWALSQRLSALGDTVQCLGDTVGFRKCGIETDFEAWEIDSITTEHARVRG